jgi:hypothetical protein
MLQLEEEKEKYMPARLQAYKGGEGRVKLESI